MVPLGNDPGCLAWLPLPEVADDIDYGRSGGLLWSPMVLAKTTQCTIKCTS